MKLRKCLFLIAFLYFFAAGEAAAKVKIVASIQPLALIAKEIAGDEADIVVLLEKSASPHHFSLTIAQALALSDADLLLWVGPEFETFLTKGVYTKHKLAMLNDQAGEHSHSHEHEQGGRHPWLSPAEVSNYASRFAEWLIQQNAIDKHAIQKRLAAFKKGLATEQKTLQTRLKPYRGLPYAVYHDAYGEFAAAMGMSHGLPITKVPHERVSAKQLTQIGNKITAAVCILTEQAEAQQAKRYANLFELPLVEVDLLATSAEIEQYSGYLANIAGAFEACFESAR